MFQLEAVVIWDSRADRAVGLWSARVQGLGLLRLSNRNEPLPRYVGTCCYYADSQLHHQKLTISPSSMRLQAWSVRRQLLLHSSHHCNQQQENRNNG